jgi:hypothetical protein
VTCELEKRLAKLYGNQDQCKDVAEGTCRLRQHRTEIEVSIEIIEDEICCRTQTAEQATIEHANNNGFTLSEKEYA